MDRQPKALTPLIFTELWERYGFYVVQTLLVFFFTQHFQLSDHRSNAIIGEYSALIYISPLLGGFFADRLWGYRHSITIGAILLFIGYCLMATTQHTLIYIGLATLVMGNGFLKPNISSFLGAFYQSKDPRRDAGYTYFYMGINAGIALSTITSGTIQHYFGWTICFSTAAVGMLIALFCFHLGSKQYQQFGLPPKQNRLPAVLSFLNNRIVFAMLLAGCIVLSYFLLTHTSAGDGIMIGLGALIIISLVAIGLKLPVKERSKLFALILLILFSIIFWALFWQFFLSVNLFISRAINRQLFGITVPPNAFLFLESFFIFLLGIPLGKLWKTLQQHHRNPPAFVKFAISMLFMACSFQLLSWIIYHSQASTLINPYWMLLVYLILTTSEMLISPIGLSAVTRLAPKKLTGLMMGVWFMATGFGGLLGGYLANAAAVPKKIQQLATIKHIYAHAFNHYALIAWCAGGILLAMCPWLTKLTRPKPAKQS